jgi:hypothetical protein
MSSAATFVQSITLTNLFNDQLNEWGESQLQNSVWLAVLRGPSTAVLHALKMHVFRDDVVCVIELPAHADWATN